MLFKSRILVFKYLNKKNLNLNTKKKIQKEKNKIVIMLALTPINLHAGCQNVCYENDSRLNIIT